MDIGRIRKYLPIFLGVFNACGPAPATEESFEESSVEPLTPQALSISTDTQTGNLSVASLDLGWQGNTPGSWVDMPGVSTSVYAAAGDSARISIDAQVQSTESVWVRVIVDDVVAQPSDVLFKAAGHSFISPHQFVFAQSDLTAGRHVVRAQWYSVGVASVRAATITVNTGNNMTTSQSRLVSVVPASGPNITKTDGAWSEIPGLATTINLPVQSNIDIVFSGEVAASGQFFAAAFVDGVFESDVMVLDAASMNDGGARTFRFFKAGVPAGAHNVAIHWLANGGGSVSIGDRTLSVYGGAETSDDGFISGVNLQTAPIAFTADRWTDIPGLSTTFNHSRTGDSIEIAVSAMAAVNSSGSMAIRALVDGLPSADLNNVILLYQPSTYRIVSRLFAKRGLAARGTHTVQIQVLKQSGGTALIADRSLTVIGKRRTGGDFARFYYDEKQGNASLEPRQGSSGPALLICLDPLRPGHPAPSQAQVDQFFAGGDGGPNVREHLAQASGNRFTLGALTTRGCGSSGQYFSPPNHRGSYYWQSDTDPPTGRGTHVDQWKDAVLAANTDPVFGINFHQYDKNKDNRITSDELALMVALPQDNPYGTFRSFSVAVDGNPVPLFFEVTDLYFSANPGNRSWNVGTIAHELSHHLVNATDQYDSPVDPGKYSLMSDHTASSLHDPFTRLKSGWIDMNLIDVKDSTPSHPVVLNRASATQEATILYSSTRGEKEYFIVENRGDGYDAGVPAPGLTVWHIVEDLTTANASPPPGVTQAVWNKYDGYGRKGIRLQSITSNPGWVNATRDLFWADGSSVGLRLSTQNDITSPSVPLTIENTRPTGMIDVSAGSETHYGPFRVLPGGSLGISITGVSAGDADLYVRKNAAPNVNDWDCRPYLSSSSEVCTVANTSGVAQNMYVMVRGYEGNPSITWSALY